MHINEPRRIVQIATIPETQEYSAQIVALCNDGSVWTRMDRDTSKWIQLPEIPQ